MIRKATKADIDAIEKGYFEYIAYAEKTGKYTNWEKGVYPTRAFALAAIEAGTMYVLEEAGEIWASMLVNRDQSEAYRSIPWQYPADDHEVLVLHTLCVSPAKAGQGIGKKMVGFVLAEAVRRGAKAVRLDAYAGNLPAIALYEKLNFRYAGSAEVLFQGIIPERQKFFEYLIEEK